MKIIGARGKALGEVVCTPNAAPRASLPQEDEAARRELMRTEWLPSKPVLPAGAATESWCGLPRGYLGRGCSYRGFTYRELRVEGVPTEEVAPVEWLATKGQCYRI